MLAPGCHFLITTPFLIRRHDIPVDCSRWTELGMKHFLAECGFPIETIRTGSWGSRSCVKANFKPNFPVSVWALAQN
jgi:hypothetical protein